MSKTDKIQEARKEKVIRRQYFLTDVFPRYPLPDIYTKFMIGSFIELLYIGT